MLYNVVLEIHSIVRWVVILTALFALIRAITGLSFKRGYMGMDNRAGLWFTTAMDIQLLVGVILYFFLSPTTLLALQNFSSVMSTSSGRFFSLEHVLMMVIAVIVAHVGRAMVRRAPTAAQKHHRTLIWFGLSLLIVLAAIPWPFLSYGRPLL